jgi:hypothetical protein
MGRFNEGKACDAVIRRIEARENATRGATHSPESEGHPAPVELVCRIGERLYAFEHTGIEPFPRQIQMEVERKRLLGALDVELAGQLPEAEYFEFMYPADAATGIAAKEIPRIRDAVRRWILETAPNTPIGQYGDRYPTAELGSSVSGVPFPVSLHRWAVIAGPLRGALMLRPVINDDILGGDLESARTDRLREACRRKFPKLAVWKREHGATTVLVLEDADMSLTNHQRVAEALANAEFGEAAAPDEIYLVSTFLPRPWWVTCLRRAGKTYYDDGERYNEVEPSSLDRLTER